MARSVHAYVRGSTRKLYEWIETSDVEKLPRGPAVWICGDCHVGNLGPIANAEGHIDIQIRDLDQTVIGNPAQDLVRLGLSLATAARSSDLSGVTTAKMLENMLEGYEQAFEEDSEVADFQQNRPVSIKVAMRRSLNRSWKQLAKDRIEDVNPAIPLGERFWPLRKDEKLEIRKLSQREDVRRLVTSFRSRDDKAPIKLLDAAYWMKGCSSLGRLRYAVLLGIGDPPYEGEGMCLMDIKEATQAAAPRCGAAVSARSNAARQCRACSRRRPTPGPESWAADARHTIPGAGGLLAGVAAARSATRN